MKAKITDLQAAPFVQDPNHVAASYIDRYASSGLPVHIAVHHVVAEANGDDYCNPHSHDGEDEINILIGDGLRYRFELDGETRIVDAPATVFMPAGCVHSANVVSGRGQYICVRFQSAAQTAAPAADTTLAETETA